MSTLKAAGLSMVVCLVCVLVAISVFRSSEGDAPAEHEGLPIALLQDEPLPQTAAAETEGGSVELPTTPFKVEKPDEGHQEERPIRSVFKLQDLPPDDRGLYRWVSRILGVNWWTVYELADGTPKEQELRRVWLELRPAYVQASHALSHAKVKAHEFRIAAGQYETYLPKQIIEKDGNVTYHQDPSVTAPSQIPGEYVTTSVVYDNLMRRDVTRIVRIGRGEFRDLDQASAMMDQLKSAAAVQFRAILGTVDNH